MDIAALRAATPGCARIAHFNHAGASLMSEPVLEAIQDLLRAEAAEGPVEAAARAADRLDALRSDTATLLHASPAEIAFTDSGATAWGRAVAALPALRAGDRVL